MAYKPVKVEVKCSWRGCAEVLLVSKNRTGDQPNYCQEHRREAYLLKRQARSDGLKDAPKATRKVSWRCKSEPFVGFPRSIDGWRNEPHLQLGSIFVNVDYGGYFYWNGEKFVPYTGPVSEPEKPPHDIFNSLFHQGSSFKVVKCG